MDPEKLRTARQLGRELQANIYMMADAVLTLISHPDALPEDLAKARESMVTLSKRVDEANAQIDAFNNEHRLSSFTALPHIRIKRS